MKHKVFGTSSAAALVFTSVVGGVFATPSSAGQSRGPAMPVPYLPCSLEEEKLTEPTRVRISTDEGCLDRYVDSLASALDSHPEIVSYGIRTGRVDGIPPSPQWPVGGDPEDPRAPTFVVSITFDRPLTWKPYVVTSIPTIESTPVPDGTAGLKVSKEDLTPAGLKLRLSALNGMEVFDVSVAWVAYDTTLSAP